jgi:hypothetical protein
LRDLADAAGFVEPARAVEERELDAGGLGDARAGFHFREPFGAVRPREGVPGLVDEFELVAADGEVAQWSWDDELERRRLGRRAVEFSCGEERDAVVDLLVLHERVNPLRRVRRAFVLGAQDQVEAVARIGDAALADQLAERRGEGVRGEGTERVFAGEGDAAAGELAGEEGVEGGHGLTIFGSGLG